MSSPDAEVSERTRERLNDMFGDLLHDLYAMRRKDGSKIEIPCRRTENPYNYFGDPNGWLFCWTVHPDDRGDYHAFDYQPLGKGAKTGKAVRWKLVRLVTFSHRNKAKARAYARFTHHFSPEVAKHAQDT